MSGGGASTSIILVVETIKPLLEETTTELVVEEIQDLDAKDAGKVSIDLLMLPCEEKCLESVSEEKIISLVSFPPIVRSSSD